MCVTTYAIVSVPELGELDSREHREFCCLLCSPLLAPIAPAALKGASEGYC